MRNPSSKQHCHRYRASGGTRRAATEAITLGLTCRMRTPSSKQTHRPSILIEHWHSYRAPGGRATLDARTSCYALKLQPRDNLTNEAQHRFSGRLSNPWQTPNMETRDQLSHHLQEVRETSIIASTIYQYDVNSNEYALHSAKLAIHQGIHKFSLATCPSVTSTHYVTLKLQNHSSLYDQVAGVPGRAWPSASCLDMVKPFWSRLVA
jgi:hypothetical protein